jgi:hypothetical protein
VKYRITAHQIVIHVCEIEAKSETHARQLFAQRPRDQSRALGFQRAAPKFTDLRVVQVEKCGSWREPGKAG